MKVVHVKDETQRDACLARLCAEVYGHDAGIAPLAIFAGTLSVLVTQEAARVLALIDNESRPIALALLVLDELGESMEVVLLTGLDSDTVAQPAERLIGELALKAPLRVNAMNADQEKMFRECGIKRWFDGPDGTRIGVSSRHAATKLDDIPRTMHFDQRAVIQAFKQDKAIFDGYKERFVRGLESFPEVL
ncbi:hypothetical protein [Halomonas sp. M20]|uniref:hypothetical protein n=1 Tax=Halomonas sp. M20 TaxID=2763264 RepID=UPI001D0A058C|nr:hypothetical protein [Halomonas sp. M20]